MGIPVSGNQSSAVQQTYQTGESTKTDRPDGASLFTTRYVDGVATSTAEPLVYKNQESYNPQLNTPGNGSLKAPPQDQSKVTEDELGKEYEAAVFQGIKQRVSDQVVARNLNRAFTSGFEQEIEDPALREAVLEAMGEGQEQVNKKFQRKADAPIPRDTKNKREQAQSFKENKAVEQLKGMPGMVDEKGNLTNKGYQTLYAVMTGNSEGNQSAQKVIAALTQEIGNIPGDPQAMAGKIGMEFEQAFQDQIAHLSPEEQAKMNYLFNMDPNNPEVKGFIDKATALIQAKWGENVQFATENISFKYSMNGEYQLKLQELVMKMAPPGDRATINAYLKAQQQGQPFKISPELKSIADKAKSQAVAFVQEKFSAPVGWKPDPSIDLESFYKTPAGMLFKGGVENYQALEGRLNTLPQGPQRSMVANLMKKISQALSELKALLFQMAASDASGASETSRGQLDLIKDKTAKLTRATEARKKERAEQKELQKTDAEKAATQQWLGPVMIAAGVLLTFVAIVVTVFTLGATTALIGLAVGLTIGLVILALTLIPSGQTNEKGESVNALTAIVEWGNKALDDVINWVGETVLGLSGAELAKWNDIVGVVYRVATIVILVAVAIALSVLTGQAAIAAAVLIPLILTFITESKFIDKAVDGIVKLSASDPEALPPWVKIVIQTVITAILMVAMAVSMYRNPGAAANAPGFLLRVQALTKGFANSKGFRIGLEVAEGAAIATTAIGKGVTAAGEFKLAEIKENLAKRIRESSLLEANLEEIDVMIKIMKKLVDSLFGQMNDFTDWAKSVGEQMDAEWASKTEMMTSLHTAQ